MDGDADIIFCAAPFESQLEYAERQDVELVFIPIGYEAFVFFVNAENSVDSLIRGQIRGIYSGEYTNWNDVGGPNRIINPVTRREGNGTRQPLIDWLLAEEGQKIINESGYVGVN